MTGQRPVRNSELVGTLTRAVAIGCFGAGAIAAAITQQLVLAGAAFLAGHTILATVAMSADRRRRGVGLSLAGVGWLSLSVGLAAQRGADVAIPETPALLVGGVLVALGTMLVVGESGGGTERDVDERVE
ncbi:hypothetical protein [Halobellus marinus]|jgi:hypothetical protein|uniref:hypothetical protein n=1 Tax=Halobellus TaxID=1073986 RepID=UPI0028AAF063|nr:hypothetical protein [Halobellus sp. DFY28]